VRTDSRQLDALVEKAAELLRAGEVVALPTETVYGLAANALDPSAVRKIFSIKGRPAHNPIIVHVVGTEMARSCAGDWPVLADKLAKAFWPGPLTLVVPKSTVIPDIVTAGGATVGLRWPSHPIIQAVIRRCGFPLAAPSANRSGEVSPTTAAHVRRSLGDRVPLVVDGGPAEVGIESTVLELTQSPPSILRPGMVHAESLAAVCGEVSTPGHREGEVLRSPGLLLKHYAPKAKLLLWKPAEVKWDDLVCGYQRIHALTRGGLPEHVSVSQRCLMPRDPQAFARALYAELNRADEAGADLIIVEAVPDEPAWRAIADRLRRAAA